MPCGSMQTPCAGFRSMSRAFSLVSGARYRVPGVGYQLPGTWYRIRSNAEGRTPSTEDRVRPPENAHTGYANVLVGATGRSPLLPTLGDSPEAMGRKARGRLSASRFGESRVCGIMPPAWDGSENEVEREKTVINWEGLGERDTDAHPTESLEGGLDSPMGHWTERLLSLPFLCRVSAAEPAQGFAGPGGRERLRGVPTRLGPALT
jgi:hypothetical protein